MLRSVLQAFARNSAILSLALGLVACGKNYHVTASGDLGNAQSNQTAPQPAADTSQQIAPPEKAAVAPAAEPPADDPCKANPDLDECPATNASVKKRIADVVQNIRPGTPGERGEAGAPGAAGAPGTTIIVQGEPGSSALDWYENGRSHSLPRALNRSQYGVEFALIKELEDAKLGLPYLRNGSSGILLRVVGKAQRTVQRLPFVQDKQVVMRFEMPLPPRKYADAVERLQIILSLRKDAQDGYPGTEIFCTLSQKVQFRRCSGGIYTASNFIQYINRPSNRKGKFANALPFFESETVTDALQMPTGKLFADNFLQFRSDRTPEDDNRPRVNVIGREHIEAESESFPVDVLNTLGLASNELLDYFYDGMTEKEVSEGGTRILYFVVADDTYVKDAKLDYWLKLTEDGARWRNAQRPNPVP